MAKYSSSSRRSCNAANEEWLRSLRMAQILAWKFSHSYDTICWTHGITHKSLWVGFTICFHPIKRLSISDFLFRSIKPSRVWTWIKTIKLHAHAVKIDKESLSSTPAFAYKIIIIGFSLQRIPKWSTWDCFYSLYQSICKKIYIINTNFVTLMYHSMWKKWNTTS